MIVSDPTSSSPPFRDQRRQPVRAFVHYIDAGRDQTHPWHRPPTPDDQFAEIIVGRHDDPLLDNCDTGDRFVRCPSVGVGDVDDLMPSLAQRNRIEARAAFIDESHPPSDGRQALAGHELGGERHGRSDILLGHPRIGVRDLYERQAGRDLAKYEIDRYPRAANDRLSGHDCRISFDARMVHG
jgi:hypothetical protein